MHTYQVTFSTNGPTLLILLTVPLIIVACFVVPLIVYPNLPDWLPLLASVLAMACAIAAVLFLYRRLAAIPATATIDDNGLNVQLLRKSPFYKSQYNSTWSDIANVSSNIDTQHNRRFYRITFRYSRQTIQLMPEEFASQDTETDFGEKLLSFVAQYNQEHTTQAHAHIHHKGFYDAWWAKLLTIIAYTASAVALICYLFDQQLMPFWRTIQILTCSTMWLAAFHANRARHK